MENRNIKYLRLSEDEIRIIKETAKEVFGKNTKIYIFGSRVDLTKKGGDIDIFIIPESRNNLFEKKLKFLVKLKTKIGEQKIDVIVKGLDKGEIVNIAKKTGVLI
ncbi:nucleotidyltransferase domain-containing protein [Persephonella sp.]